MEGRKRIGLAMCGSYCTYSQVFDAAERLAEKYELVPIMSENAAVTDSRFGAASEHIKRLMLMTGKKVVTSIVDAEPLGPSQPMEAMLIAPCTGNTLAKLANGITAYNSLFDERRPLRLRGEYRKAPEPARYLFRAVQAGRSGK